MAIVKGNAWGHLSGKVGNFSARINDGRTILGARPVSFRAPQDTPAINRKKLFASASSLAGQAINLPALKKIWDLNKEPYASGFNKAMQVNRGLVSLNGPTVNCVITPNGFAAVVQNALVDPDKVTAVIPALTLATILSPDEVHCSFYAVICFHTPLVEGDEPYSFIRLSKDVPNYNFAQQYNLQLDFNVLQKPVAAKYDSSILYLAIIPMTADERIKQWSGTFSQEF